MARGGGKLTKLKSVLKKLNSFNMTTNNKQTQSTIVAADDSSSGGILHPVYVGKSRRRYLITSDILDHPLLRGLASESDDDTINVCCEVVLFEHLLWMIGNADPQTDSMNELVEFYAC